MRTRNAALWRTIAGALAWALLAVAPAGWAGALVTDVRGQIGAAGGGNPALLSELMPGAELRLGPGARITLLLLGNGEEFTLKGPGRFTLVEDGVAVLEGAQPARRTLPANGAATVQLRAGDGAQATLVLRGADSAFRLLAPVDTALLADRPAFRWSPADSGASYRFTLLDDASAEVFQATTTETKLELPAAIRLREGAAYSWTVEVLSSGRRKRSASGEFTVLDAQARTALERMRPRRDALFADRVAYALMLDQYNARDAALEQWRRLAAERPGEPNLQRRADR